MRTFAQKPKSMQQTESAESTKRGRTLSGQSHEVNSILHLQRTIGNQAVKRLLQAETEDFKENPASGTSFRLTYDFSRIPVHTRSGGNIQPNPKVDTSRNVVGEAPGIHELARRGLNGSAQAFPHLATIHSSFGRHTPIGVSAYVGGPASDANARMGSSAFTYGNRVAFRQVPDLHTAAHEAAHIVQQRAGVQLPGGVGKLGDRYEQHADAVADAVVRGQSAEALLDQYRSTPSANPAQLQFDNGGTAPTQEEICEALRTALENSRRVIALYHEFLAGNVDWKTMRSHTQTIGNAAQGVTGAGHSLPQVVQDAIEEVESFGLEELGHFGRLLVGLPSLVFGSGEFFQRQWATNEIERQEHFNLVLIESLYEHGCPDFPGTWRDYQQQVLSVGTRGREVTEQPGTTSTGRTAETRTGVAWVEIAGEQVLVLATEVGGSRRLRFVRWISSEFRELSLQQAQEKQGTIPQVPASAVDGLPASVPDSAARR